MDIRLEGDTRPGMTPPVASVDIADPDLGILRSITRQMATSERLETVLDAIVNALGEYSGLLVARIFLLLEDHECAVCRENIEAGKQTPVAERRLHLVAEHSNTPRSSGVFHIAPLDSRLPVAELVRTREPTLVEDWRSIDSFRNDPMIAPLWSALGIVGVAGYPLEVHGEILGAIGGLATRVITREEFNVLGIFADQAAMAIKSAYLFQQLARHRERLEVENEYLQDELRLDINRENIIGQSAALRGVLRKVQQVASVETTVLLTGETGTGKELIARAIHDGSPRKSRPLIKINCGAIPEGIIESELFGHERGAFTGAIQQRIGRFELADKGTLFMDEVGELPLETQVKLLRVLQEQEFERVGSTKPIRVDVRLLSATNRDLQVEVAEGRFRADLFYRLNVFPIRIPPLRERPDDIPILVEYFLTQFQRKFAKSLKRVDDKGMEQLQRYPWPGNIRELQNVLERACVLATGPVVSLGDSLRSTGGPTGPAASTMAPPVMTLEDSERAHIKRALEIASGKVHGPDGAAVLLGINPSTLRSRMEKLGLAARPRRLRSDD
jgi:transcriptional regulator with GAF, ATPase, and Fis domain